MHPSDVSASPSNAPRHAGDAGADAASHALTQLGTGSADDRLGFREVLHIFWRTLPLLLGVGRHLVGLLLLVGVGLGFLLFVGLIAYDAVWQGVLQGKPLQPLTSTFLLLDPQLYGMESGIDEVARRALRSQVLILGGTLSLFVVPFVGALAYYQLWILQRINQLLRTTLIDRFQALSLRFHSDSKIGDSIYRVYQDSAMVTNVIRTLILEPLRDGVLLIGALAATALVDGRLAGVLVLTLPLSLALGFWYSGRLRVGFREAREANSALTSRIQETLSGIKVVKAFGAEQVEQARFERDSREAFQRAFAARSRLATYGVLLFWVSGSLLLYAFLRATELTMEQVVAGGAGVAAAAGLWTLARYNFFKLTGGLSSSGIEGLFSLWGRAQDIAIGLDRVFDVLDLTPEITEAEDAVPMPAVRDKIRFQSVSFGYRPDVPVLRDVDFEAHPGTITAIVGPTGSGKSTLVSLLLRLYDPDRGRIEIDGVDLRQIQLQGLRDQISIALQENVLFGMTIRENIRYAVPDASDEEVRAAATVACADSFIREQRRGYDTLLGERGAKLSTGQRQRISIARAVLKDTPILILDEPTAALDAETELEVLQNLAHWGRERAIFMITHRLSTIRRADQIIVLRDGRVVERGSHDELMRRGQGAYRGLFEIEDTAARAQVSR